MPLQDIAVDAFNGLLDATREGPITIGKGVTSKEISKSDVEVLQNSLLGAIRKKEIMVLFSDNDRDCPLKDNGGGCVTFLTETGSKQLSVDMGRILRHQADPLFLLRAMIHEAYRLSLHEDLNDQYSRRLAELVQKNIDPNVLNSLGTLREGIGAPAKVTTKVQPAAEIQPSALASSVDPADCPPEAKEKDPTLAKNLGEIEKIVKRPPTEGRHRQAAPLPWLDSARKKPSRTSNDSLPRCFAAGFYLPCRR